MATTLWGTTSATTFPATTDAGDQFQPAVADSGGGSFGIAWTSSVGVTVRFYDVVGAIDPGLGTIQLTSAATASDVSLTAGGAVGYAAAWEENGVLMGRYVGLSAPVGAAFVIDSAAGESQHDAATSGYAVDGPTGKPIVDGFNVAWISSAVGDPPGFGRVMLQRFAVPLDARVDPTGPPVAAGLDGVVGGDGDLAVNVGNEAGAGAAVIGRDVAIATDHADSDTLVAWIDTAGTVHARLYTLNGTPITIASGAITGIASLDALGTAAATSGLEVISTGSGFVVAWTDAGGIVRSQVLTGGGASTFAVSQAALMNPAAALGGAAFTGEFSLGALIDTNGFVLTVGGSSGGDTDLYSQSFGPGGGSDGVVTRLAIPGSQQSGVATAALVGDRVVTVYQDDPTAVAGDQDIHVVILDTRNTGIVLNGDPPGGGGGGARARPDVLVGTSGNDTINGLAANDELYGALGDDILTGGAGNDTLDGGGSGAEGDVATFSANRSNYTITHIGGDLFTVVDIRNGSPEGTDTLRGIETLRFNDGDVTTASIILARTPVTPTAWGWSNVDGDTSPDGAGIPDVDGFIVNRGAAGTGRVDTNPFVADSVGEFVAVAWESAATAGGQTRIRGQFYDVTLAPDAFIPNTIDLSDGIGIESNAVIVSGGANSGWGVAFEQLDSTSDTTHTLRTNFVGPGQLTGPELSVLAEAATVDQHSAAMSGSFLDRTLASPVGGSVLPVGMNDGYNVTWVSTETTLTAGVNPDGLTAADIAAGYGRIMLQRFEVPLDALGNPGAPAAAGIDGIAGLGSDAAVRVRDEGGTGVGGAIGRDPSTAALHTFETAVIWIERDAAGNERVAGQVYDDLGQVVPVSGFDDISGAAGVAAGTTAHVVSAGAVNFGIVWVASNPASPSGLTVMGTMYASAGTGLNGAGFSLAAPGPFALFDLPAGVSASDLQLAVTGISGEDSSDLVVSWKVTGGSSNADVMAQHVAVALDPVTGLVLAMGAEGNAVTVNAATNGNQDGATIAGLLGDRFITVYHDTNGGYTDGNDIVARVMDTRDATNPLPIVGDLVRAGVPQSRRDVLIGTNGNDDIRGDISNSNGLVDFIFAGMGDDTIQGGPGLRGAAGIPEIIDGGEGNDIAVYTGRRQDYSITLNGDGSYEVIDLRSTGGGGNHDGIDNLVNVEQVRFLDLSNGGAGAQTISLSSPVVLPVRSTSTATTPVPWSLTDTTVSKEIRVDVDLTAGTAAGARSGITVTNLQDGAALTWIADNGAGVQDQVWAISYDITGQPDPVLLAVNTQLTDGLAAGATVSDLDIAMTAGLGFTAVWESSTATDTTLHMRFASTNTFAGGIVTPGLAGGEMQLTEAQEGGAEIAVDPVIQGYEIVDTSNNSLEVGFHVGFVMQNGANDTTLGDRYGALTLARYEIPVYALDGAGNLTATPSTPVNFGVGAEMAPISIGLDGRRGTADDGVGIVVTSSGLFAANNPLVGSDAAHTAIQGRDISIGSLHDGQLVVTYVGTDERVHLRIYVPNVNQTADRETLGDGTAADVVATGLTTYSELALPFSTTLGLVASPTQMQYVVPQQNGSFGVFWAASGGSGVSILGVIYSGAGTSWTASPVFAVATGLPSNVDFQVAPTGVNAGGLEDGFFVTWEAAGAGIQGQRIDMVGALVGNQIVVGDPASGTPGLHSTAGIDDGRMLVGYQDGNDVSAQYLDNRTPGDPLIGPRTGAPRDVIVGTVGDDAIDGRALDDELYGGLGNDFLTLGTGADIGDGGAGNDSILGGAGQDQLIGQGGDDLLWGGLSGPIDPQVDRDLRTGLAAAGISAALIATDPGADIVSGGAGTDTISFQDEIGNFNVDLSTGIVTSDRSHSGTFILEDVIGLIDTANATFNFSNDVENVTGGLGDDRLTGDAGSNVLDGREGNDTLLGGLGNDTLIAGAGSNAIDGGAGTDTATFAGTFAGLSIGYDAATGTLTLVGASGTDIVSNVETFVFTDGTKTLAEVIPGPAAVADAATGPEDTPVTIAVLANDANVGGAAITAINSIAIVAGGAAVAVAHGSVALVDDGTGNSNVVFTPDADYFGPASFTYTVANASGQFSIGTVSLTITNTEDAPTDILFNGVSAPPASGAGALGVLEGAATGTVIATLTTTDPDNTAVATNDAFTYSLADTFGGRFRIVGGQIQVDNGALLDVESGTTSYTLAVTSSDGKGGSISKNVVVNVTDVDEAPTTVALSGGSIAETAANGSPVGTLSAVDPEGGAVRFTLGNDAGGRFAITTNAAGVSQLIIAENLLIDHRPGAGADGPHTYAISVNALDAAGNSRVQAFTVTTTGVAENRVLGGTAADNTLTGTAGADYIDGGAGKDTMTGQAGNDVYVIDNSGDKVIEAATGGTDTIYTSLASLDLGGSANVENLVYTGTANFNGKLNGTGGTAIGNTGNDQLQGGGANDVLEGLAGNDTLQGGNGNDTLIGGAGNDLLSGGGGVDVFTFRPGSAADTITDFAATGASHDFIEISAAFFANFSALQSTAGAMQQVGQDVLLTLSPTDVVTVQRVTVASLVAADFRFV